MGLREWFPTVYALADWIPDIEGWLSDVYIGRRSKLVGPLEKKITGLGAKLSEHEEKNEELRAALRESERAQKETSEGLAQEREKTAALEGRVEELRGQNAAYQAAAALLEEKISERDAELTKARADYASLKQAMQAVEQARGALEQQCGEQEKQLDMIGQELAAYRDGEKKLGCSYQEKIAMLERDAHDLQLQRNDAKKAIEMLDFYYRHAVCDPAGGLIIYSCYNKDGHGGNWDSLLATIYPSLRPSVGDLLAGGEKAQEQLKKHSELMIIRDAVAFEKRLNLRISDIPDYLNAHGIKLPDVDKLLDLHHGRLRPDEW